VFGNWNRARIPLLNRSCGDIACCSTKIVKDMGHWTPMEREKPHYLMKSFKPPFGEGMMTANDGLSTCEKILAPEFLMK